MGLPRVSLGDLWQEGGTDDTTAAPDLGDLTEVKLPLIFLLRFAHELETLSVRTNFRAIECVVNRFEERFFRAFVFLARAFENLRSSYAFFFDRADATGKNRFGDRRSWHTHVERIGRGQIAGDFFTDSVEHNLTPSHSTPTPL